MRAGCAVRHGFGDLNWVTYVHTLVVWVCCAEAMFFEEFFGPEQVVRSHAVDHHIGVVSCWSDEHRFPAARRQSVACRVNAERGAEPTRAGGRPTGFQTSARWGAFLAAAAVAAGRSSPARGEASASTSSCQAWLLWWDVVGCGGMMNALFQAAVTARLIWRSKRWWHLP